MGRESESGFIKEAGIRFAAAATLAVSAPVVMEHMTASVPQAAAQGRCEVQGLVTDYLYSLGSGHSQYDAQGRPIFQPNIDIIGNPAVGHAFDITALGRTVRLVIDGRGQGVDSVLNRPFADFVGQPDTTNRNQPAVRMTAQDVETGQSSSFPVICNTGYNFQAHTFQEIPSAPTKETSVPVGVAAPATPENPNVSSSLAEIEASLKKFSDEVGAVLKASWNYFADEGHNPLAWTINGLTKHGSPEFSKAVKFGADNLGACLGIVGLGLLFGPTRRAAKWGIYNFPIVGWGIRRIQAMFP